MKTSVALSQQSYDGDADRYKLVRHDSQDCRTTFSGSALHQIAQKLLVIEKVTIASSQSQQQMLAILVTRGSYRRIFWAL